MEIIFGVLVIYGIFWAGREGIRAGGTARTSARQRAVTRGGTHNRGGSARRAARQATAGYWANAIRHGFPVEREGFGRGWREHQQAMTERQRDGAKHRADLAHLLARLQAETAAHRHRMNIAQRMGPPTMSAQLRATPVRGQAASTVPGQPFATRPPKPVPPGPSPTGDPHMGAPTATCTNKNCSCHVTDTPPLADGKTPGAPPANGQAPPAPTTNGGTMTMPEHGQDRPGHDVSPTGAWYPGGGGGGGGGSDFNLDQIVETAGQLQADADNSVNTGLLAKAPVMADAIGHLVPTDQTTNGIAGDVAAAALKVQEGYGELQDAAAALKARSETVYRQLQEAKDASGEDLPEPQLLEH